MSQNGCGLRLQETIALLDVGGVIRVTPEQVLSLVN